MTKSTTWNDGYAVGDGYTHGFFPQQSPEHLNYACVLNGVEPIPLDRPYNYFELGFGQGLTVMLLAASNPHARFYANDFMPEHVAAAEELASSAKLDNVTFLEDSFADLAAGKVDLPQFDFITMHGVYTWVSAENRQYIVNFIARYLKPGGIVYTGYNAMPGWAPMIPLQKLMLAHARSFSRDSVLQTNEARKLIMSLARADSVYFADNPDLQRRLKSMSAAKSAYLAHEYLNEGWQPCYHAEVATEFSAAKLSYAGSAMHCMAFDQMPAEQQKVVDSMDDPLWRETLKDFFLNTGFRHDVFVRGCRKMSNVRKTEWLKRYAIGLTVPRDKASTAFKALTGQEAEAAAALIDVLAQDPCTLDDLAKIPLLKGRIDHIALLTALLTHTKYAAVFMSGVNDKDIAPAHRLNCALVQRSRFENRYKALASPLLGSGIETDLVERLVYLQLLERPHDITAQAIATYVVRYMREQAEAGDLDATETSALMDIGGLVTEVEKTLGTQVPIWRQLKMI